MPSATASKPFTYFGLIQQRVYETRVHGIDVDEL